MRSCCSACLLPHELPVAFVEALCVAFHVSDDTERDGGDDGAKDKEDNGQHGLLVLVGLGFVVAGDFAFEASFRLGELLQTVEEAYFQIFFGNARVDCGSVNDAFCCARPHFYDMSRRESAHVFIGAFVYGKFRVQCFPQFACPCTGYHFFVLFLLCHFCLYLLCCVWVICFGRVGFRRALMRRKAFQMS